MITVSKVPFPEPVEDETLGSDVVVVGGGGGGLAAAVRAAQLGANVILLERNGQLGHRIRQDRRRTCG